MRRFCFSGVYATRSDDGDRRVRRRDARCSPSFDKDLRHVNWVDLVPAFLGDVGERACKQIRSVGR